MKNIFIFIAIVLLTTGCATQLKIETDSDKVYDLTIYNTFSIESFDTPIIFTSEKDNINKWGAPIAKVRYW